MSASSNNSDIRAQGKIFKAKTKA